MSIRTPSTRQCPPCCENVKTKYLFELAWIVRYLNSLHSQHKTVYRIDTVGWLEKKFEPPLRETLVAGVERLGFGSQTTYSTTRHHRRILPPSYPSIPLTSTLQIKGLSRLAVQVRQYQHKDQFGSEWYFFHSKFAFPQPPLQSAMLMKILSMVRFWIMERLTLLSATLKSVCCLHRYILAGSKSLIRYQTTLLHIKSDNTAFVSILAFLETCLALFFSQWQYLMGARSKFVTSFSADHPSMRLKITSTVMETSTSLTPRSCYCPQMQTRIGFQLKARIDICIWTSFFR